MKAKVYSAEELLFMDPLELIGIYNRVAERQNKRVTRANQQGGLTAALAGNRVPRIRSGSVRAEQYRNNPEQLVKEIMQQQNTMGLTPRQMVNDLSDAFGNRNEEFQGALRHALEEKPEQAREIANKYRSAMGRISSGAASGFANVFYQALKIAVENHEIESFSPVDRMGTMFDYQSPDLDAIENILDKVLNV